MQLKTMKKLLIPVFCLSLFAVSCGKTEEDTTAPEILSLSVETNEVSAGGTLIVKADNKDETALNQLKLNIHDRFDGHGHEKIAGVPWEEVRVIDLDGKEYFVTENFDVPDNATAGPHHVIAQLVDGEGNTSDFKEVDFWVYNSDMAFITVLSPDLTIEPYYAIDDTLNFAGSIADDEEIAEITVIVKSFTGTTYYEQDIDLEGQNITNYDLSTLPSLIFNESDFGPNHVHLEMEVIAIDNDGNINEVKGNLHYN